MSYYYSTHHSTVQYFGDWLFLKFGRFTGRTVDVHFRKMGGTIFENEHFRDCGCLLHHAGRRRSADRVLKKNCSNVQEGIMLYHTIQS